MQGKSHTPHIPCTRQQTFAEAKIVLWFKRAKSRPCRTLLGLLLVIMIIIIMMMMMMMKTCKAQT